MIEKYEHEFLVFAKKEMTNDPAHDINHVLRVVKTAKALCQHENANLHVVLPAAYLHDCFSFPKNHPERAQSSKISADKAIEFLTLIAYPTIYFDDIHHAIIAHSYSANVKPRTLEAKIVQDADRLDSLGAIGITRCLQVSASLGTALYNNADPFCKQRLPDDRNNTVDHFYVKLFNLVDTMNTESAKIEGQQRTKFMHEYLEQLEAEI
ncbi:HD domain-containing protein [Psychromonas hadalis]|uniref:HD domain-containing protein n=1 Tax=Psychromonas hadalis TaxID=211669 RepID=UPI0003B5DBFB|nr:HD domain-containing protein [Psychromonas hadalis]